jgi:PTS system galactitol-specific IIC component
VDIFIIFSFFLENVGKGVNQIIENHGLHYYVLDVGWPPLASLAWSFRFAPILFLFIVGINFLFLYSKFTKTLKIDIWNFCHYIFVSYLVYNVTESTFLSLTSALLTSIFMLKIADLSAYKMQNFIGLEGITSTTITGVAYFPIGVALNKVLDRILKINNINFYPDKMGSKMGFIRDPLAIGFMIGFMIGFLFGFLFGIWGGYDIKNTLELDLHFSAFIYILPKMCEILGEGIMVISENLRPYLSNRFKEREIFIAIDQSLVIGNPSVWLLPFC